ncbi:CHAT domain-containing protein [Streptomyces europaeiscabiei]|uniref:CHAT domain-containing protein n=1 Tax=Streptomyces europaeiscabiei TaxID=146819 RepID=UPI000A4E864E|nr:CHAT domain-containing protein [Streptomyces europaeiscabiei]MDX3673328.1 CHAT domain-containing protein [Streptomyces europaeiscabiei]MDX3716156.1 CHAT domain-containing protein [Streptomyces europaeiscabiei]MDX3839611.1 CHAT domain-containing protein [Streptomyces europaeiscabiei]MDX3847833.1 CHAT domain-containing protein [Streptomyces europaeiscabiei]MDX3867037.1 CHAT domain-containing protein [Streptomyces europaeiscabiei]
MALRSHRFLTPDDLGPLLRIAAHEDNRSVRTEALAACAALPLDEPAAEEVAELVLRRFRAEPLVPDSLVEAAGHLPVVEVRAVLEGWAADDGSAHQEAARRALATRDRPAVTPSVRGDPGEWTSALAVELAVTARLLDGRGFPSDLSPLASLFESGRQRLLSVLIATLVDAVDEDDETLRAATERLGQVVEVLPDTLAADLPELPRAVPDGRADWLGAVLSLAPPAEVVGSAVARLRSGDLDERLATLRELSRAAPHLGRPPVRWPEPTSRPGELAHLARLLLEPATGYEAADEPPAAAPLPRPPGYVYEPPPWYVHDAPFLLETPPPLQRKEAPQPPAPPTGPLAPPPEPEEFVGGGRPIRVERTDPRSVHGRVLDWWKRRGVLVSAEGPALAVTAPTREAYARLDAPQHVVPDEAFELRVGLAPLPTPEVVQPAPFTIPAETFTLDVSVLAPGFAVVGEDPLTLRMRAGPDDPYPYRMLRLRAVDDPSLAPERVITAVYAVAGNIIGVAHRTVRVGEAPGEPAGDEPRMQAAGGVWVLPEEADAGTQPDLEIVVAPGNDAEGRQHCWLYRSPHPGVGTCDKPLVTTLGGEADWARSVMRGVQERKDAYDLAHYLKGVGREASGAVPEEVWAALRAAGERAGPPSVLLATWDPYVPWELALLSEPLDPAAPAHLGAQAVVGRWIYGDRQRTPAPPAHLQPHTMSVVTGDYAVAELKEAKAEAKHLIRHYRANPVDATTDQVLMALEGERGPDILHLAVHGKFSTEELEDGLQMVDGTYLSRRSVSGVEASGVRLVFLNACQVGQGRAELGAYAGMVPAFLGIGAQAAVAPLWNVDDKVAKNFAQDFYKAVLKGGTAPAEYLRRRRAGTLGAAGAELSTPLAYLFFGHPRLTVQWTVEGAPAEREGTDDA